MNDRQPIDPALRRYLDQLAAAIGPAPAVAPPDAQRVGMVRGLMAGALAGRDAIAGLPNDVEVRSLEIAAGLGARLFLPPGRRGAVPLLVYLHGGGWVVGSSVSHTPFCQLLCAASGVAMLAVDYRLAPEHPYPAALEDTLAAFACARREAAAWGCDPVRLAIGGDSAGANLAAVAANRLCAAEPAAVPLRAQLLLYPVTASAEPGLPSYQQNASGCGLEAGAMRWFWRQYAPQAAADDPDLYPLLASLPAGLPPTLVATAEYDVLRDDGIAYAARLRQAGVAVIHQHAPDMHHNFPVHPGTVARFPQSVAALAGFAEWLRLTLRRGEDGAP